MTSRAMTTAFSTVTRRLRRPTRGPQYRLLVVIDITGSARWHDQAQLRAREVLRAAIHTAVRRARIGWADIALEDRGDGLVMLISPNVSKVDILDPVVPQLAQALRAHNATVAAELRIRLRVSFHAGEVHRDTHGWAGSDLNTAFRLVDGPPLYQRLAHAPDADLVLVVSDPIYQGVVRHHYRAIDPATYTLVQVSVKEVNIPAWLHTPGSLPPRQQSLRLA
jgi:hypothetical protein